MRVFKRRWIDAKTGEARESEHWHLEYTLNGKRYSHRTFPATANKRTAEEQLKRYAVGAVRPRPVSATVGAILDAYARHLQREAPSTWRSSSGRVEWWRARYGHLDAAELTLDEIGRATEELRRTRAPGTVFGYLTMLRAAINRAILDGQIASHPASRLEIRDRSPKRRVLFTDADVSAVCAALPPWAAGVVRVSRETGLRLGDVLALRWENVEADRIAWRSEKPDDDLVIPLTAAAQALFASLPRGEGLVFPRPARKKGGKPTRWDSSALYKVWWPALEKAGLSSRAGEGRTRRGKTFHDLRRTWASEVLNAGASLTQVAQLLGQETTRVTDRYTVHDLERLREAAERGRKSRIPC